MGHSYRSIQPVIRMSELPSKSLIPSCPLCKQEFDLYYRTPRVVPRCGHTFCEKCIASRLSIKANRKVFLCPECTAEVVVRRNVQEDLPKNIGIIDVVKNMRKYSTAEREEERKTATEGCPQHHRALELVCETCAFKKICSHCVLFGEHHSHNYRKQAPPSSLNIKELKEVFELVASSVKLVLLPDSESNLKQTIKTRMSEGLKKAVRSNFKQYYDMVERKECEALQECENIVISEGGIDRTIDRLVQDYDHLKCSYELEWTTSSIKIGKTPTVAQMDDFIARCEELHNQVISIQDQATHHVEKMLKEAATRISQAVMFKIQELSFSLKRVIEGLGKEEKEITSPERKARLKSANSEVKSRSMIENEVKAQANDKERERNGVNNKSQSKSVVAKKNKNNYSQIDKEEMLQDDFSLLETGKSDLRNLKEQTHNNKELKDLISNKYLSTGERISLPPKAVKPKLNDFDSKTVNLKEDRGKGISKDLSPAKTVSLFNKPQSGISQSNEELKFVRPTKEISFQFLTKFQEIMVQTDRQADQNTLELVSLDINDTLLLYLLDYLKVKKQRFQVIKLVKNLITDEGFKTLLSFLVGDTTTQLLNLTSNHLTPRSLELVLLFAEKNNCLKAIYLGGNKISAVHVKAKKSELLKHELQIVI